MSAGIVIAAGGTAGHVYPGLAVADALRRARPGVEIRFVGTPRGIEREAVPAAGYPIDLIEVVPWARSLGAKRFTAPASLVAAAANARGLLKRLAPAAVVGMGGYASLPAVLAARSRGIPAVLHEQNAIPGIANVIGARTARRIGVTFPETRDAFPSRIEVRVVGNPLREQFASFDRASLRAEALAAFELEAARRTVLVTGGSLGAARLNEAAVGLAERWRDRSTLQLLVSAGREQGRSIRERLAAFAGAILVRCVDYIDRIELAYAAADAAVCRAGAATVMELAAVAVPAVLVPYPYARSNHQEANARALERFGGARVVLDDQATAATVGAEIEAMLDRPGTLGAMAGAAAAFAKPRAADDLAAWVLAVADRSAR